MEMSTKEKTPRVKKINKQNNKIVVINTKHIVSLFTFLSVWQQRYKLPMLLVVCPLSDRGNK